LVRFIEKAKCMPISHPLVELLMATSAEFVRLNAFITNYCGSHDTTMPVWTQTRSTICCSERKKVDQRADLTILLNSQSFSSTGSCWNPRLCPMACARLAARMWGSKTLMSTEMPTAFPAQIVPTVAVVDFPLSKVCPLLK